MAVEEFSLAINYITKLYYTDKIEYNFLYQCIKKAAQRNKCTLQPPFDWELKGTERSNSVSYDTTNDGLNIRKKI